MSRPTRPAVLWEEIKQDVLARGYGSMTDQQIADDMNTAYRTRDTTGIANEDMLHRMSIEQQSGNPSEFDQIIADPIRNTAMMDMFAVSGVGQMDINKPQYADYFRVILNGLLSHVDGTTALNWNQTQTFKNFIGDPTADDPWKGDDLRSDAISRAVEVSQANGYSGGIVTANQVATAKAEQQDDPSVVLPT